MSFLRRSQESVVVADRQKTPTPTPEISSSLYGSSLNRLWNKRLASSTPRPSSSTSNFLTYQPSTPQTHLRSLRLTRSASSSVERTLKLSADSDTAEGLTDSAPSYPATHSSVRAVTPEQARSAGEPRTVPKEQYVDAQTPLSVQKVVDAKVEKPLFQNRLLAEEADPDTRLTVVLDLDETLVYNRDPRLSKAVLRPYCLHALHALRCLEKVEIVLWTASTKETASRVVDQLQEAGFAFDDIIFRNDLWFTQPFHTKDLRLLGRDLSRVVIIDNSACCCKLFPQNSILIEDFAGNRSLPDAALVNVYYIVQELAVMRGEKQISVQEGLRKIVAGGALCHTVTFGLPDHMKNLPLEVIGELRLPPLGRFIRANTAAAGEGTLKYWCY